MIACDANGYILFMNGVAEELTGWTSTEAFEEKLSDVFRIVHEETRRMVESPVDKVRRLGTVVGLANHTLLLRRDGTEISIDDSGAPIHDAQGVLTGVVLVFRDITDKRRAERNLELLSESGRALSESLDLVTTLKSVARLCTKTFADYCYFDLLHEDGTVERAVQLHRDPKMQSSLDAATRIGLPSQRQDHPVNQAMGSAKPILLPHIDEAWLRSISLSDEYLQHVLRLNPHTLLVVPILDGERLFGTLSFARSGIPGAYHEEDQETAIELGRRIGAVLAKVILFRASEVARETARLEREKLHSLFLQAPAPVMMMSGPELRIELANTEYVRLTRRNSPEELTGRPIREAMPDLDGQGFFELLERVYQTGVPFFGREMVAHLAHPDTGEVDEGFFNFVYQPTRDAEGKVDGILVFAVEITEQVRARQEIEKREQLVRRQASELEAVYKTAPIGLALFDPVDFRYLRLNDRQASIVGLPAKQILGRTLTEIAPIKGLHEMFEGVAKGVPLENALLEGELPMQPGVHRYWTVNYFPVLDQDGSVEAITAASLEITAQKRAEQALIQNEKIAAVGRLASSIAHEINNPLESITNLLYIARNSNDVGEIHSYLEIADRELRRISLIASQTLRFYRQSTRPQAIQCRALVESVLSLHQGRLVNSGVQVETGEWVELPVACFEGEIRQVLNNLVGNALDAMPHGGRLIIRSHEGTDWATGKKGLKLTFADTGAGIPAAARAKIFEPFFTTKGLNGTGLGLWISKEIVAKHKGWIRVKSSQKVGQSGTVFSLWLPFDAVLPDATAG